MGFGNNKPGNFIARSRQKIRPFSAQTTRSWQKTPVLGKIRPFAVQSSRYPHAIFSIEINVAKEE